MLSAEQVAFFKANGYLIVRDILNDAETAEVQKWAQEVHDWTPTADSQYMPYEEINSRGETVLCRTENYADSHEGFNGLLRGKKLLGILEELSGEPMYLFKEKINYKLAGSGGCFCFCESEGWLIEVGGFAPHIDAVAYNHIKDVKHLTILLAVDKSTLNNGGLEVVEASHNMDIPLNVEDHCIADEWVDSHEWKPVELEPGQLLIFTSYLAHRSGPNHSNENRKALYATYNRASEGNLHQDYYELRKKEWPATHMRKEGETYEDGALRYAFGSPMLSVDAGRQLAF
ncbi:Epoxidase subunit A [Trichoderma simmonsii]|uniref:Epoxidase subunit A n=1 Tax=Trichoderma simmonsii TaxID=1491479 RepID=A0A8G0PID9_9HYPO|nr:Epoxidase subunit A [Trichoderma simmonsii]